MAYLKIYGIEFKVALKAAITSATIISITLFILPANSFANEELKKASAQCYKASMECDALTIKGAYFIALQVVYERDFKNELNKLKNNSSAPNRDESKYLSNIDNYDFYIELTDGRYHVGVGPTMRPGFPEYFGGLHYEVDAKSYKILNKWRSK